MGSTGSCEASVIRKKIFRAVAEGAVVAVVGSAAAAAMMREPRALRGLGLGVATAWLVSSVSVAWLLWGREQSMKAFWWAFGGGMALRVAALGGLMGLTWRRAGVSAEAALLSYVFGVLAMLLMMESRHFRVR